MLVDDARTVRRLGTSFFEGDAAIEVVATAENGREALDILRLRGVDLVVLDVEMPGMGGLEALRAIRLLHPSVKVLMFSALTRDHAELTLEALAAGASDYVPKPSATERRGPRQAWAQVRDRIAALFPARVTPRPGTPSRPPTRRPAVQRPKRGPARIILVGSSTGGPAAVELFMKTLAPARELPVVIAQHMPAVFTEAFAGRLARQTGLDVREARDGEPVRAGVTLVAPGGHHLRLVREKAEVRVALSADDRQAATPSPSVDALFESAAPIYQGGAAAVVLTGMGSDGLVGARALAAVGATLYAQDQASSVVWGMPRVVVEAELAQVVGPPDELARQVLGRASVSGPYAVSRRGART